MNPQDLRTWIFNHRAAAERERVELRKHPMSGEEAFAAALALLAFDESINGSPFGRDDSVSRRERTSRFGKPGRNSERGGSVADRSFHPERIHIFDKLVAQARNAL